MRNESIWIVKEPVDCSCVWRKILKVINTVELFMTTLVGNGLHTKIWFDKWHKVGVLGCVRGYELFQVPGVEKHDKVACLTNEDEWIPGIPPIEDLQQVWDVIPNLEKLPFEVDDKVVWTGASTGKFTSSSTWNLTREIGEEIAWWEVVWCNRYIPKHSFVVWRALLQRLPTQSRLCHLRVISMSQCCFCWNSKEDLDHLFFECAFSKSIWSTIMKKIYPWDRRPHPLAIECSWIKGIYKGKSTTATIGKLAFNASIYHIWRERNQQRFNGKSLRVDMIIENIKFKG